MRNFVLYCSHIWAEILYCIIRFHFHFLFSICKIGPESVCCSLLNTVKCNLTTKISWSAATRFCYIIDYTCEMNFVVNSLLGSLKLAFLVGIHFLKSGNSVTSMLLIWMWLVNLLCITLSSTFKKTVKQACSCLPNGFSAKILRRSGKITCILYGAIISIS